jgi:hypothetical protein
MGISEFYGKSQESTICSTITKNQTKTTKKIKEKHFPVDYYHNKEEMPNGLPQHHRTQEISSRLLRLRERERERELGESTENGDLERDLQRTHIFIRK